MKRLVLGVMGVTVFALFISGAAQANSALRQDPTVDRELFAVAVGDRIRKQCDSISARIGVVWSRARALERHAKKAGFSSDQIDAYLGSKPDQERYKARAKAYLAERGAKSGDAAGHCAVGRAEIAAKSPIGTLLKAR